MWFLTFMPSSKRLLLVLALVAGLLAVAAAPAFASSTQESIIEDDGQLHTNLDGTLATMRSLGATVVKVAVYWDSLAPDPTSSKAPKNFDASNLSSYPAANWAFYDSVVRAAHADGLKVGFMVTGPAPGWAVGPGVPKNCSSHPCGQWKPSASDYGGFVHAVGERYDGSYTPAGASSALPRVSWWSIWNEPNYGPDLAPQATNDNKVDTGAIEYRALVDAAWSGLSATGHRPSTDTILIGETAPRGIDQRGFPGNFSGTVPVLFIQALYCVTSANQEMRGATATENDCPSSASKFRAQNPALFQASGYADHPYAQGTPPNVPTYACAPLSYCFNPKTKKSDPYYLDFPEIPRLEGLLNKVSSVYGSHTQLPIWNTEYGYWTNPPDNAKYSISPALAALYLNWAEYLSYENPRIASYSQYLLIDPPNGQFASGLELSGGQPLATFAAFQMPMYMPTTSASKASDLTVWGGVRPLPYSLAAPAALVQFQPTGSTTWTVLQTVTITNRRGYFDVKVPFTQSGSVRIAWSPAAGQTDYSRTQAITVK